MPPRTSLSQQMYPVLRQPSTSSLTPACTGHGEICCCFGFYVDSSIYDVPVVAVWQEIRHTHAKLWNSLFRTREENVRYVIIPFDRVVRRPRPTPGRTPIQTSHEHHHEEKSKPERSDSLAYLARPSRRRSVVGFDTLGEVLVLELDRG